MIGKPSVGAIVYLASGGPAMTVADVRDDDVVSVEWFAGPLLQRDAVYLSALRADPFDLPDLRTLIREEMQAALDGMLIEKLHVRHSLAPIPPIPESQRCLDQVNGVVP